jgi:hypothetical protein|eukprot:SAG25_NODE_79_length_16803_cov_43.538194_12_plen_72_part_00
MRPRSRSTEIALHIHSPTLAQELRVRPPSPPSSAAAGATDPPRPKVFSELETACVCADVLRGLRAVHSVGL